jgi:hypothetical protein
VPYYARLKAKYARPEVKNVRPCVILPSELNFDAEKAPDPALFSF